ncbi:MAG: hypothetical protein WKG06_06050 [Segetibacter sp.]
MIISNDNKGRIGSFKLGYSRGLPSYKAPKLFNHTKTGEYFVTSLFAQQLIYNGVPVTGIEVCENDSNKGADTVIKILDDEPKEIQITRFTLTEYLKRRNVAEKQVDNLITKILNLTKVPSPVNITVNLPEMDYTTFKTQKIEDILADEIAIAIQRNQAELSSSNNFVNYAIVNEKLKSLTPLVTLQGIPKDFHSNFFGRDNVFIDLDYDNIGFNKNEIEDECLNIYNKKTEVKQRY